MQCNNYSYIKIKIHSSILQLLNFTCTHAHMPNVCALCVCGNLSVGVGVNTLFENGHTLTTSHKRRIICREVRPVKWKMGSWRLTHCYLYVSFHIKQFLTASNIDLEDILETPPYFVLPAWCIKPPKIVLYLVHLKKDAKMHLFITNCSWKYETTFLII